MQGVSLSSQVWIGWGKFTLFGYSRVGQSQILALIDFMYSKCKTLTKKLDSMIS